jgi:gluconolactonase
MNAIARYSRVSSSSPQRLPLSLVADDEDAMERLIPSDSMFERLDDRFVLTEGPIWIASQQYLLFSDVKGDARYRWDERHGTRRVAAPTGHANGMTIDLDGRLLVCEHDTSTVARMSADGAGDDRAVVASHVRGAELNSPNDVVVHSGGAVYFTDPPWGRERDDVGKPRPRTLDFQGVMRVDRAGEAHVVADDFERPNGLCFSPDESLLYVNDTARGHIRAFPVRGDGTLAPGRVFAAGMLGEDGGVDGMKCDEHGNVWVTAPGGIWAFDAAGRRLGVVRVPQRVGNMHWGGPDWSWLLITAQSGLYRLKTAVRGRREPFMG